MLVVPRLELFGVVAAHRSTGLDLVVGIGAVLRQADRHTRMLRPEIVEPGVVVGHVADVPAEVQVVRQHVGHRHEGVVGFEQEQVGHRRQPCRVEPVGQRVQFQVRLEDGRWVAGDGDLVRQTPADDARMVAVLHDELGQLTRGVGRSGGEELGDLRDLGPHDDARGVAQVVEVLVVLVVGETDRGRTDLLDQFEVGLHHVGGDRVADPLPVLVAGHSTQRVRLAVEQESEVGVDGELAATEAKGHFVDDLVADQQACGRTVEVRIAHAVPTSHVVDHDFGRAPSRRRRTRSAFHAIDREAHRVAAGDRRLERQRSRASRRALGVTTRPGPPWSSSAKCDRGTVIRVTSR